VEVVATERLIDYIIETGVDSKMGARPLSRRVSDLIKLPLSKRLLFEEIKPGIYLTLDWVKDQLVIKEKKNAATVKK
jgi:ATP-dependent Clp protease ATP-binding subunit ClpA